MLALRVLFCSPFALSRMEPRDPARLTLKLRALLAKRLEKRAALQSQIVAMGGLCPSVPAETKLAVNAAEGNFQDAAALEKAIQSVKEGWWQERGELEAVLADQARNHEATEEAAPPTKRRETTTSSDSMEAVNESSDCDQALTIRVGTDCSGMEAPIQSLQNLGVRYDHVFASDRDKHVRATIEANFKPSRIFEDVLQRDHSQAFHVSLSAQQASKKVSQTLAVSSSTALSSTCVPTSRV